MINKIAHHIRLTDYRYKHFQIGKKSRNTIFILDILLLRKQFIWLATTPDEQQQKCFVKDFLYLFVRFFFVEEQEEKIKKRKRF